MNYSESTRKRGKTRRPVNLWPIAKYAALTVAGVLLFRAGAAVALNERGYRAIGGEIFALFLPVLYWAFSKVIRDFVEDLKKRIE